MPKVATEPLLYTTVDSPVGELLLLGDRRALSGLHMQEGRKAVAVEPGWRRSEEPFSEVRAQLAQYFAGRRVRFDLPLVMSGTPFQQRVWDALQKIPYGETLTYGEVARTIGKPSAARAVGLANGSNPISVIVPCHRVVGADGALTGYGGGLERKQQLLSLEADSLAASVVLKNRNVCAGTSDKRLVERFLGGPYGCGAGDGSSKSSPHVATSRAPLRV